MATLTDGRPQQTDWLQQARSDLLTRDNHRDLHIATDTGIVHVAVRGRSACWTLRVADAVGLYAQLQARIAHLHSTYQQEQHHGGTQRRLDIVWTVPPDALCVDGTLRLDDFTPNDEVLLAGADVLDGEAERSWPLLHGDEDHRFVPAWDDRIHAIGVQLRSLIAPLMNHPQTAANRRMPDDLLMHALRQACILEPSERRAILFAHMDHAIPDSRRLTALLNADAEAHQLILLSGRSADAERIRDLTTRRRYEWDAVRQPSPTQRQPSPTQQPSRPTEPPREVDESDDPLGLCDDGDAPMADSDFPPVDPPPSGDAPTASTVAPVSASPQQAAAPSPQMYADRLRAHVVGQDEATKLLGLAAYRFGHAAGAHYTSEADILRVVGPTIINPLRERLAAADSLPMLLGIRKDLLEMRVLDPACGSGNFLYVAYREMKRFEADLNTTINSRKDARRTKNAIQVGGQRVSTKQFFGCDILPFATELAKVTLMIAKELAIAEAQHDPRIDSDLIKFDEALPLENLDDNFSCDDALFKPWPPADVIIGNPPFQSKKQDAGGVWPVVPQ